MPVEGSLRIALLTYRGKPTVGGQGVYVRHLSKALADLDRHRFCSTNNLWFDTHAMKEALDARDGILGLPLIKNVKNVDPGDKSSPEVVQVETAMGAAIEVFEGPPLQVTAAPPQATVTVGGRVNFNAVVTGNDGSALSDNWNFGGGASSSTQQSPDVTFDTAGVWTVNLEVTDAGGGGGGDQTTVTVN